MPHRYSMPTQRWWSQFWVGREMLFTSPTTLVSCSYSFPMSRAKPLKVCYHLAQWRRVLLVNWFRGMKTTHLPQHAAYNSIRLVMIFFFSPTSSLCSCPKTQKGLNTHQKKNLSREKCETFLEGELRLSIYLFFFPSPMAHKDSSRQACGNQFHGAVRWK